LIHAGRWFGSFTEAARLRCPTQLGRADQRVSLLIYFAAGAMMI
jgi:hypothetical protein